MHFMRQQSYRYFPSRGRANLSFYKSRPEQSIFLAVVMLYFIILEFEHSFELWSGHDLERGKAAPIVLRRRNCSVLW